MVLFFVKHCIKKQFANTAVLVLSDLLLESTSLFFKETIFYNTIQRIIAAIPIYQNQIIAKVQFYFFLKF